MPIATKQNEGYETIAINIAFFFEKGLFLRMYMLIIKIRSLIICQALMVWIQEKL